MTKEFDKYTEEQYQAAIHAMGDSIGALIVGVNNSVAFANEALTNLVSFRGLITNAYKARLKERGVDIENIDGKDLSEQLFGNIKLGDEDDNLVM